MYNYSTQIKNNNYNNNIAFTAKKIPTFSYLKMERAINKAENIGIVIHSSPDPDAIGSAKAAYDKWTSRGKNVYIFAHEKELDGLIFDSNKYKLGNKETAKKIDLGVFLDCNKFKRIPQDFAEGLEKVKKFIGLDHHDVTRTTTKGLRIDKSACSTCSLVYRYLEKSGEKIPTATLEDLFYGMVSDAQKSKMISISKVGDNYILNKLPKLLNDKNSNEIMNKLEAGIPPENRMNILKSLDIMSNLTPKEKAFHEQLYKEIQLTPNGELAYVVIHPQSGKLADMWKDLGMDSTRNSTPLCHFRTVVLNEAQESPLIAPEMKEKLKNVQGVMVFYRTSPDENSLYQMSITTKDDYASKLRQYIVNNLDPEYIGGGHPHRQGGRILTCEENEVKKFINQFMVAAENVKKTEVKPEITPEKKSGFVQFSSQIYSFFTNLLKAA